MLLIAENMPATSEFVPLIGEFENTFFLYSTQPMIPEQIQTLTNQHQDG